MKGYWDHDEDCWIPWEKGTSSVEDEYFASLEAPAPDYTPELILALSRLTDKQKWVIECHFGFRTEGRKMPVREIADLMGVHHRAVEDLIHRALRRLEQSMRGSPKTPIEKGLIPVPGVPEE